MKAEIKTFGWSGDIRQTVRAVEDLKRSITDAVNVARNDQRTLAVIAHSWGGVLSYLALRDLEGSQTLRSGDIAIFITIHTPLANRGSPSPNLATVYGQPAWAIGDTVKQYVKEELQRPRSVTAWNNYWSSTEVYRIGSRITVADANVDIKEQHEGSHTNPTWLDTYGAEIAVAVAKHDNASQTQPELTFRLKNGNTVIGKFQARAVTVKTPFGTSNIPVVEIVAFGDGEFRLRDGTVVKGEILDAKLHISTPYGVLALAPGDIAGFGTGLPAKASGTEPQGPPPALATPGSTAGTAKPARPTERGPLPQSFGLFVSAGGRLYELRPESAETGVYYGLSRMLPTQIRAIPTCCAKPEHIMRVQKSPDLELILHRRGMTSPDISVFSFNFVRKLLWITSKNLFESTEHIKDVDMWLHWSKREDVVQAPIPGQPDMIRIRLRESLDRGLYGVKISSGGGLDAYPREGALVFAIDTDPVKHSDCWDWKVDDHKGAGDITAYPCSRNALGDVAGGRAGSKQDLARKIDPLAKSAPPQVAPTKRYTVRELLGDPGLTTRFDLTSEELNLQGKIVGEKSTFPLEVRVLDEREVGGERVIRIEHEVKTLFTLYDKSVDTVALDGRLLRRERGKTRWGTIDAARVDKLVVPSVLIRDPVYVGASWEVPNGKCEVLTWEAVRVPWGSVEAFRIRCEVGGGSIEEWVAPGMGRIRLVARDSKEIWTHEILRQPQKR
jgi:hypothetical protein